MKKHAELERRIRLLEERLSVLSDSVVIYKQLFEDALREIEERKIINMPAA